MKKRTFAERAFPAANASFLVIIAIICILPFLLVVMVSFSDEHSIETFGYLFWPHGFSLDGYKTIFRGNPLIFHAYFISIVTTVAGTLVAVLITAMGAFTLANRHVKYRNGLALFFAMTMFFSSGFVPWYMVCRALGLKNNIFALVVPSLLFNPFNLFLVRNFMRGIPDSLMESAKIDGALDSTTFFRIYLPLTIPVLATIALFYGLAYWNNWFNAIMLVDSRKLYPLQYLLFQLQSQIQMMNEVAQASVTQLPPPNR